MRLLTYSQALLYVVTLVHLIQKHIFPFIIVSNMKSIDIQIYLQDPLGIHRGHVNEEVGKPVSIQRLFPAVNAGGPLVEHHFSRLHNHLRDQQWISLVLFIAFSLDPEPSRNCHMPRIE